MSYKLVTDHWIVKVAAGDSHESGEYTEDKYCWTEEEMKKTFEKFYGVILRAGCRSGRS